MTWDSTVEYVVAGAIDLHVAGDTGTSSDYVSVCTDIGATLVLGNTYTYSQPQEFSGHSGIKPIWGAGNQGLTSLNPPNENAQAAIQAAADIFYNHSGVLSGTSATQKAALQLAVWEALYDTSATANNLDLSGGRFSVDPTFGDAAAISLANDWVNAVNPNARYIGYLLSPTPEQQYGFSAQELFYAGTGGVANIAPAGSFGLNSVVPEPATLMAGVLLLVPFGVTTLRILRNRAELAQ